MGRGFCRSILRRCCVACPCARQEVLSFLVPYLCLPSTLYLGLLFLDCLSLAGNKVRMPSLLSASHHHATHGNEMPM